MPLKVMRDDMVDKASVSYILYKSHYTLTAVTYIHCIRKCITRSHAMCALPLTQPL